MNRTSGVTAWTRISNIFSTAGVPADQFPAVPGDSRALDRISSPDVRTAPHRPVAPFGVRERTVGAPAALFAHKGSRKTAKRERTAPIGQWRDMLRCLREFGVRGQIAGINRYINNSPAYGVIADYAKDRPWTSPIEFLRCADESCAYALAKYLSLRLLGFHAHRLRLVWMTTAEGHHHSVLTVALSGQTLVLDSRSDAVLSDQAFEGAEPYVSMNGSRFCLHWHPSEAKGAKAALGRLEARLSNNEATIH
ncbi:MAG: transglutaminase-like cysteine peptidase [Rhodospirillales bacterium]|nr:transglutaminase-like cysteine peptidase [Rhodospirillales bacterium]